MNSSHPLPDCPPPHSAAPITEFRLAWPGAPAVMPPGPRLDSFNCCIPGGGSTHELAYDRHGGQVFWVSGQNYDHIARVTLDGSADFFAMPKGSMPHGLAFDHDGKLWVTFEGLGELAQINPDGGIALRVDIGIHADGAPQPLNPRPHGLGIGADGALWFTGKLTNTVGRVDAARNVQHFALPTIGAVPIYIAAGPDGHMWCSELGSGQIARISNAGEVTEYAIPTPNARPIAVIPGPDGNMWFTEEAGGKVARIELAADRLGQMTEFSVPLTQSNAILGGLTFDRDGNLWVQQYVNAPTAPPRDDYIVRLDRALLSAPPGELSTVPLRYYKAPSQRTIMHRIVDGPDGNIWFVELGMNQIGKLIPDRD